MSNKMIVDMLQEIRSEYKELRQDLNDEMRRIDQTLLRNTLSLEEHMRRTDELEKLNNNTLKRVDNLEDIFNFFRDFSKKTLKIATWITGVVGSITAIVKIISWLK